jgi:hypothetical protein
MSGGVRGERDRRTKECPMGVDHLPIRPDTVAAPSSSSSGRLHHCQIVRTLGLFDIPGQTAKSILWVLSETRRRPQVQLTNTS